jgi:hypothetical protein
MITKMIDAASKREMRRSTPISAPGLMGLCAMRSMIRLAAAQMMESEHYRIRSAMFFQYSDTRKSIRTTTNGIPLFIDWRFHQDIPAGIGIHFKIRVSHVMTVEARSAAKMRKPTARRQ